MRSTNVLRQFEAGVDQPRSSFVSLARKSLDTLNLWLRRADDRRRLREMSPYMHRDIGVDWVQAEREAGKPFWRS